MRAFVSDLDGTLLNNDQSVPRQYDDLYHFLAIHGIPCIVASARPLGNIRKLFERHPAPRGIVACDGAIIASLTNGVISQYAESSLSQECVNAALKALRPTGVLPVLFLTREHDYAVITESRDPVLLRALNDSDPTRPLVVLADTAMVELMAIAPVRAVSVLADPAQIGVAFEQVSAVMQAAAGVRVYSYAETRFGGGALAWLDVVAHVTRKEDAVTQLLRAQGFESCEFVACGNGDNDIAMLQRASLAICPINSVTAVRTVCGGTAPHAEGGEFIAWVHGRIREIIGEL